MKVVMISHDERMIRMYSIEPRRGPCSIVFTAVKRLSGIIMGERIRQDDEILKIIRFFSSRVSRLKARA